MFKAIDDYFDVDIELSIDDLFAVIDAYFEIRQPIVGRRVFSRRPAADNTANVCGEAASHWGKRKDEDYVNEFSANGRRVLYAAPPRG